MNMMKEGQAHHIQTHQPCTKAQKKKSASYIYIPIQLYLNLSDKTACLPNRDLIISISGAQAKKHQKCPMAQLTVAEGKEIEYMPSMQHKKNSRKYTQQPASSHNKIVKE